MANGNHRRSPVTEELKVIMTGSVGSGKTTAINAISEVPVCGTEAKASEQDALHRKATTTVAMEYGITCVAGRKLHLYGTPGQRRFDFMAEILCKGANGMVIMIDNGSDNPLKEIDYYCGQHGEFLSKRSSVICVTHFDDLCTQTTLLDYHQHVRSHHGLNCPVMKIDPREKNQVKKLLGRLLQQMNATDK